jgi:hypothetical protein
MATIDITITYPDGKAVDLRDTLAAAEGYLTDIPDGLGGTIPNSETKTQFVLRRIKEEAQTWIRGRYNTQKALEAQAVAPKGDDLGLT